jgi:hypothetical protein
VVNDSPETLTFPGSFTTSLGLRLERGGRVVPTKTSWERIEVALPDDGAVEVGATVPFNVFPQGVARFMVFSLRLGPPHSALETLLCCWISAAQSLASATGQVVRGKGTSEKRRLLLSE